MFGACRLFSLRVHETASDTCRHLCLYVCECVCAYTHALSPPCSVFTYTHARTHARTHTYTHTHTHTHTPFSHIFPILPLPPSTLQNQHMYTHTHTHRPPTQTPLWLVIQGIEEITSTPFSCYSAYYAYYGYYGYSPHLPSFCLSPPSTLQHTHATPPHTQTPAPTFGVVHQSLVFNRRDRRYCLEPLLLLLRLLGVTALTFGVVHQSLVM